MINKPLTIEVKNGELQISIGAATLAWAVQNGDQWDGCVWIKDPEQFAQDMIWSLGREEEDGSTPVHIMLDQAAEELIQNGMGLGWDYDEDENDDAVQDGMNIARALLDKASTENE